MKSPHNLKDQKCQIQTFTIKKQSCDHPQISVSSVFIYFGEIKQIHIETITLLLINENVVESGIWHSY